MKRERLLRDEAAAILGLPARTVLDLAAAGRIPGAAKLGRRWTFDERTLRAWVRAKENEAWEKSAKPRRAATGAATRFGPASRSKVSRSEEAYTQTMARLLKGG